MYIYVYSHKGIITIPSFCMSLNNISIMFSNNRIFIYYYFLKLKKTYQINSRLLKIIIIIKNFTKL